jgi:predicted  nucleic acid-binding Zn-ribbon protein
LVIDPINKDLNHLKEKIDSLEKNSELISLTIKKYKDDKENIKSELDKIKNSFLLSENENSLISDSDLIKQLLELPVFLKILKEYEDLIFSYICESNFYKLELLHNLISINYSN